METLNKNWFAFTLIAVIFGLLGYVIGKQCGASRSACPTMNMHHKMMKGDMKGVHMIMAKDHDGDVEWIEDMEVEKEEGENGEKTIHVKVKGKKDKE